MNGYAWRDTFFVFCYLGSVIKHCSLDLCYVIYTNEFLYIYIVFYLQYKTTEINNTKTFKIENKAHRFRLLDLFINNAGICCSLQWDDQYRCFM